MAGHNVLVKISKKSDGGGTVPTLGVGTAWQALCLGYGRVLPQLSLGSRIYEDTLSLGCNSVQLLPSLLASGQGPQGRMNSLPVGCST